MNNLYDNGSITSGPCYIPDDIESFLMPKLINQILRFDNVSEIIDALIRENTTTEPYSERLRDRIASLYDVRNTLVANNPNAVPSFDHWISAQVTWRINKEKMSRLPPSKPKGFWESLFS